MPSPITTETGFGGVAGVCVVIVIGGMTAALAFTVQENVAGVDPALSFKVTENGYVPWLGGAPETTVLLPVAADRDSQAGPVSFQV